MRTIINRSKNTPVPFSGLALGIAGFGLFLDIKFNLHGIVQNFSSFIAFLLIFPIILKFVFHFKFFVKEFEHPIISSVIPTFAMSLMFISKTITNFSSILGSILWFCAVFLHIFFIYIFTIKRIGDFEIASISPSWFVTFVGIAISGATIPNANFMFIAKPLFWFGFISFLFLFPFVIARFLLFKELETKFQPTLAIITAPAGVCLVSYLSLYSLPNFIIVNFLINISMLTFVLVFILSIFTIKIPFSFSFASFTFPLSVTCTAMFKYIQYLIQNSAEYYFFAIFLYFEIIFTSFVFIFVCFNYLKSKEN